MAETNTVTAANFENYRTLQNGNTYLFVEDIDFTAPATESALRVARGDSVVIEIPKGMTVKLMGGAASAARRVRRLPLTCRCRSWRSK